MAKLYAELTSDKGGRVASKGGETFLELSTRHQNRQFWNVKIGAHGLLMIEYNGKIKKFNSLTW